MTAAASPFLPGARIDDRFVVTGVLGSGGMGVVLRAKDLEVGREVALKLALGGLEPTRLERFQREATLTAGLSHPGIVRVHSSGLAADRPWIAFELVEGARPLGQAWTGLDPPGRAALVRDAARALGHAHARGVVHRDVKAENVLVDDRGAVRVADFGLATATDLERLTHTGAVVGTPWAMAPEQFQPGAEVGPAADVWALGVLLYEALAGQRPFEGATLVEVAAQVLSLDPPPPSRRAPGVPPALDAVCLRALERSPTDRHADGEALALELDRALRGEAIVHRRRGARRARLALLPAAALLVVGALALAYHPAVPRPWRLPRVVMAPQPAPPSSASRAAPASAASPAAADSSAVLGPEAAHVGTRTPPPPGSLNAMGRVEWLGAHDGVSDAMVALGGRYHHGSGVPRDLAEALRWYLRAADDGSAAGACKAGELLWSGGPGVEADRPRALALLRKAAVGGDGFAMRWLARKLLEGAPPDLERDPCEAYAWFQQHALRGDPDSMLSVARLLSTGTGVATDEAAAARWLERALAHPDRDAPRAEASLVLGRLLRDGRGVARDEARAARLFQAAVDEDNDRARLELGLLYRDGRGVPRDVARAEELLAAARRAKVKGAGKALAALRAELRAQATEPPAPGDD